VGRLRPRRRLSARRHSTASGAAAGTSGYDDGSYGGYGDDSGDSYGGDYGDDPSDSYDDYGGTYDAP
jgi:hypothetical protein